MRILIFLLLIALAACKGPAGKSQESTLPPGFSEEQYGQMQRLIRSKDIYEEQHPVNITLSKMEKAGLAKIHFQAIKLTDTMLVIPARFNLDTHTDFITHPFLYRYDYAIGNDTIFQLSVDKEQFSDLLDSTLRRYGVLRELEGYHDRLGMSDSFHIYFTVKIPGTAYEQAVILAGDSLGNITTYRFR